MKNYDGAIWATSMAALIVLLVFIGMVHDCPDEQAYAAETAP